MSRLNYLISQSRSLTHSVTDHVDQELSYLISLRPLTVFHGQSEYFLSREYLKNKLSRENRGGKFWRVIPLLGRWRR
jgi:hypothetical protein